MPKLPQFRREREAALEAANIARAKLGLPPMDHLFAGKRSDGNNCPITNTVFDDDLDRKRYDVTTSSEIEVWDSEIHDFVVVFDLPPRAQRFVGAFDRGKMPDLEINDRWK